MIENKSKISHSKAPNSQLQGYRSKKVFFDARTQVNSQDFQEKDHKQLLSALSISAFSPKTTQNARKRATHAKLTAEDENTYEVGKTLVLYVKTSA